MQKSKKMEKLKMYKLKKHPIVTRRLITLLAKASAMATNAVTVNSKVGQDTGKKFSIIMNAA